MFDPNGALDPERNAEFARGLVAAGVRHLFALGSLGEFPSIEEEERTVLLRTLVEAVPGPVEVWAGCGAPSTARAVRFAEAADRAGASVLVAVPPYYLRPTEGSIVRYYRALRAASDRPLLAYNIPSLVGYALRPELVHRLAREGSIVGIKDTSGALPSVLSFLANAPSGFSVLPGDDALASESMAHGAVGAIMGSGNVLPRLAVELVRAAKVPAPEEVRRLQGLIDRLVLVSRSGPFPSTDKFLAEHLRGVRVGYRHPYGPLEPEERAAVLAALEPHRAELRPWS